MPNALQLILVLLAASVVVVVACRLVRLPPILGYLIVGVAVGPHALAWVPDDASTRYLAEFGIVFLMFSIGLEFSLAQLHAMRRAVFGLGLAQVAITTIAGLVALQLFGFPWQTGLVLGGALAMSSTAIVSKLLAERMELATPHGRDVIGILLFQDLAVVAFLIVIPSLAGPGREMANELLVAAAKAVVALTLILYVGQKPMRTWFHVVARQRSPELFMLNLLLVTLGLAALTEAAGLSLALGAFLAGMLIAETEYRYQVEEDIKPFRDVLLGLFFVTVGMALELRQVIANAGWVLFLLVVPVAGKLALVVALARAFGSPLAVALRTGFYLAQAGEFALVMLALSVPYGLIAPALAQSVLAAMILSMLAAPVVIQFSEAIVRKLTANDWLARAAQLTRIAATTMARQEHVIICGYGRSGQNLARLLEREDIGWIALDNDPQRVREAAADGASVVYGDASRREALAAAGLGKARALAVTFASTGVALRILHHVQQARPDLPVIVRTLDDSEMETLYSAGATEVIPGSSRGQPDARDAFAARARRAAQSRAEADPAHSRGALQPVPRLLPWRERRGRCRREPAAAAALGRAAGSGFRGRAHARRARHERSGGSHRRAPPRHALAATGRAMALRAGRRGRAARPARSARRRRTEAARRLTCDRAAGARSSNGPMR